MDETPMLSIHTLKREGFFKAADVNFIEDSVVCAWEFTNISSRASVEEPCWVYCVVVDDEIAKLGETGLKLFELDEQRQCVGTGTQSRMGRLRRGSGTDRNIREALFYEVCDNRVSIWATKCKYTVITESVLGEEVDHIVGNHKQLESMYIKHIKQIVGKRPPLNKIDK
jgi:hypothetical protein